MRFAIAIEVTIKCQKKGSGYFAQTEEVKDNGCYSNVYCI